MAARGVPPEDLRKRMGHASIITTLPYYVHVVDGQARQAAKVAIWLVPLSQGRRRMTSRETLYP